MVSDIASILLYASWALVGFICECSSLTFQSILWSQVRNCSISAWQFCLLLEYIVATFGWSSCICFGSDEELMRQLDACPMQSCLFRKGLRKTIPPLSQLWKYLAIFFLNIPHLPIVIWNSRSFSHFFLIQDHATSFYPGISIISVQSLFPLPCNNIQAPQCLHLGSWDISLSL